MNKYIQKLIKEQFNISDLDFSDDEQHNANIFNKVIIDINKMYNDMLLNIKLPENDIDMLNYVISDIKPKSKKDLKTIINNYSNYYPNKSLNWLDVSDITDMSWLFYDQLFDGDISEWDVSNVETMEYMYYLSSFNNNIAKWNVSNVLNMACMFEGSKFNQDISNWDVSKVTDMHYMFSYTCFDYDISNWNVDSVINYTGIFRKCDIKEEHMPQKFR